MEIFDENIIQKRTVFYPNQVAKRIANIRLTGSFVLGDLLAGDGAIREIAEVHSGICMG